MLSWWTVMYQRVWPQLSNYNQVDSFVFILHDVFTLSFQQSNTNNKSSNDEEVRHALFYSSFDENFPEKMKV